MASSSSMRWVLSFALAATACTEGAPIDPPPPPPPRVVQSGMFEANPTHMEIPAIGEGSAVVMVLVNDELEAAPHASLGNSVLNLWGVPRRTACAGGHVLWPGFMDGDPAGATAFEIQPDLGIAFGFWIEIANVNNHVGSSRTMERDAPPTMPVEANDVVIAMVTSCSELGPLAADSVFTTAQQRDNSALVYSIADAAGDRVATWDPFDPSMSVGSILVFGRW